MGTPTQAAGPDFAEGVPLADLPEEGTLGGRVGDEPVLLSRFGGELFAVSGTCTHYGAALALGLVAGTAVRCPLHHACFDLRSGAAERTPALDPLDRWRVEIENGMAFVRHKLGAAPSDRPPSSATVEKVVIVGGGAAGLACAHELRRLGYPGSITMLSAEGDAPCDRPNLSKDYLAGTAPAEWLPLRSEDWYAENAIRLELGCEVQRIDPANRCLHSVAGDKFTYDRLLLATGCEPNRLRASGFQCRDVFTLRTLADAKAIAAGARTGARAVIVGGSFIGMEAAAALRQRGVKVTVVTPEHVPFEGVFGAEIGSWFQQLHQRHGVDFSFGVAVAGISDGAVKLANGTSLSADFVLLGIGVRPRIGLAATADLATFDGGVRVDRFLRTSQPDIFAAGDIASYPDPTTGEPVRIEHWVVAERQGQAVAANMLGHQRPFQDVPFFWTEQFGVPFATSAMLNHGTGSRSAATSPRRTSSPDIMRAMSTGHRPRSGATWRSWRTSGNSRRRLRRPGTARAGPAPAGSPPRLAWRHKVDLSESGTFPLCPADDVGGERRHPHPGRRQVEEAVRTLIAAAGDDPDREGLRDTPSRVARAYGEWFAGYHVDPRALLAPVFTETEGYEDMVLLRDIPLVSTCEHHLAPIAGKAHVAYRPAGHVVGISKLARLVDAYARRLQLQERLTSQIANALNDVLSPRGVAVAIEASHGCMSTRGVNQHGVSMVTKCWLGDFRADPDLRRDFLGSIQGCRPT